MGRTVIRFGGHLASTALPFPKPRVGCSSLSGATTLPSSDRRPNAAGSPLFALSVCPPCATRPSRAEFRGQALSRLAVLRVRQLDTVINTLRHAIGEWKYDPTRSQLAKWGSSGTSVDAD